MFSTKHISSMILLLTSFQVAVSQQWELDSSTPPDINVTGTSSLTDWTVTCAEVQDVPNMLTFDHTNPGQIQEFSFKVPVEGMDGGRGSSMNDKILEAFKATEHPFIQYQQTTPATVVSTGENGVYAITSSGSLTMAGTSKSVTISCTGTLSGENLVIRGNHNLRMSDFEMTPPSAMFGQIKTNDDVVISYEFQYLKK
jgi:polyisoprenoid-binding protein YceI